MNKIAATLTVFGILSSSAYAQDIREIQQRACTGDAFRLCSDQIPDEGRITACMTSKKTQLSRGCLAVFDLAERS